MDHLQNHPQRRMRPGKEAHSDPRTSDEFAVNDDTGMSEDIRPEHARAPSDVRPEQQHSADPLKPDEADEYGTRLEKAASKIVPPGREVRDEDIMDPGHMTPNAPPVDNQS